MTYPTAQPLAPGWYPDPAGGAGQRWHDGQGWTGRTSYAAPRQPLAASFARLADWLARLLIASCVLNVAALLVMLWTYSSPDTVDRAIAQAATGAVPTYLVGTLLLLGVILILYWVTGIVWLFWQHRLAASAPEALRSSPAMHVVWWFIPFAAYWVPARNISDLWRSYGAHRRNAGPVAEPVAGPPIVLWWTFWILAAFFVGFTYLALLGGSTGIDSQTLAMLGGVGALLEALAAGMAVLVVRQVSWQALLVHVDAS